MSKTTYIKNEQQPTPTVTAYDDAPLKARITALENKQDRDNQTLTINNRTLSISGGNSITLPEDRDTIYNDTDVKRRLTALEGKRDNDNQTLSISNNRLTISNGNSVDIPQPDLSNYVTVNQYNELKDAFTKLLEDLKGSGTWEQTGDTIFKGNLKPNRHLATGNINLFGGQPDGDAFIRTNNGSTENDLTGGI